METLLKTLDGPESKHQDMKGHEFTRNDGREKAAAFFFKKIGTSVIALNQISNLLNYYDMQKQLALVLTLIAFFMTACEDEHVDPTGGRNPNDTIPPITQTIPPVRINAIYPNAGPSGSTVAIFGENFGASTSDNYVTFDSTDAEILYVREGMLSVRVPMNLAEGNYSINVSANGRVASAPRMFSVTNRTD